MADSVPGSEDTEMRPHEARESLAASNGPRELGAARGQPADELRRLAVQTAITRVLADADTLPVASRAILRTICETLGLEMGAIWRVDAETGLLRCVAIWRAPSVHAPGLESYNREAALGRGVALPGLVWQCARPLWMEDAGEVEGHRAFPRTPIALRSGMKAALGFPIVLHGEVTGVLEFLGREIRQPDAELLELLSVVGAQIGQFIHRKETEERLRASEARFRAVFEAAGIGMGVARMDARFLATNRALEEMLGYTKAELAGKAIRDVTYHEDLLEDRCLFEEMAAGRRDHYQLEKRYVRKDGDLRWGRLTVSLVRDGDGTPEFAIGIVEDISERKRLEQQFRQAQKMEAVGRPAGGVAHDFNNLLLAIRGYSELALSRVAAAEAGTELAGDLEQIRQTTERAALLTRQLLAFSRKQLLQPRIVDLDRLVANMEGLLRGVIGEDVEVTITRAPALGNVRIDPGQMEQAIMNIVINAREAMPAGGRLAIETSNVELERPLVRDGATLAPGSYVTVRIEDTGCGMDAETKRDAFEPFFTTKSDGTGLGLSTVYGFVKQSDGFVFIDSEPGSGTSFTIYLPLAADAVAESSAEPPRGEATNGTETVLLAEDEDVVRAFLRDVLEREGYAVLEARHGLDALAVAERHDGPIHVFVTDLVMPVLGGPQAAERLTALHPETRVIYMSGYADESEALADVGPAAVFLHKPFAPAALAAKVREALDVGDAVTSR